MSLTNNPILQVQQLTTRLQIGKHPFKVVDQVSFDLKRGQTLALVGESGCGKSMTALSILRILPTPPALPSEGKVIYKHKNLLQLSEKEMRNIRGAKIAMIFQDPMSSLNPVYSVANQLVEVAELHLGLYGDDAIERATRALSDVGISSPKECLSCYPHQLSGGMKQRVMIAMALMCEPDILIADEPTTSLDVTIQAQVLELMRNLQSKHGMAILLITHDMGVVAEMAHDVVVMYATQAVEWGSVDQLFDHHAHPYTQGLFQARPSQHVPKKRLEMIKGFVPPVTHLPSGCRFHPRCPYAMEICQQKEVPDFVINDPTHQGKCWLYDTQIKKEQIVRGGHYSPEYHRKKKEL